VHVLGGLATSEADNTEVEMITLLLLSLPQQIFSSLPENIQQSILNFREQSLVNPIIYREVCDLQHQLGVFQDYCACSKISPLSASDLHHRFVLKNKKLKDINTHNA
jgi:hypothetical protein